MKAGAPVLSRVAEAARVHQRMNGRTTRGLHTKQSIGLAKQGRATVRANPEDTVFSEITQTLNFSVFFFC